ncbi:MAG TPA: IPT/TIG domain-containing protein, partial [Candidatus Acidoferrales bacterium]|nr:IPT/TIG domain-containing protein [Candidatus Acidoferrales bacterium]
LSTSKFQFFLWTGIIVFAYVALFASDVHNTAGNAASCPQPLSSSAATPVSSPSANVATSQPATTVPSGAATSPRTDPWCPMPDLPVNMLLAMGFSIITVAGAKGITTAYVNAGRVIKPQGAASLSDLVSQDGVAAPDLSKVQMLTWTIIASVSYLYSVTQAVPHFNGSGFPDINPALMVLMGIGQGAYLSAKVLSSQTTVINRLDPSRGCGPGTSIKIIGSGFGATAGIVQFGDVVAALGVDANGNPLWSDGLVQFVIPTCHSNGAPFAAGETVYVAVLLQGSNATAASNTAPYTF